MLRFISKILSWLFPYKPQSLAKQSLTRHIHDTTPRRTLDEGNVYITTRPVERFDEFLLKTGSLILITSDIDHIYGIVVKGFKGQPHTVSWPNKGDFWRDTLPMVDLHSLTTDQLASYYDHWNANQGLELGSADEHLYDPELTESQHRMIAIFCDVWSHVQEYEDNEWRLIKAKGAAS